MPSSLPPFCRSALSILRERFFQNGSSRIAIAATTCMSGGRRSPAVFRSCSSIPWA
ncbi:hypothetical protein GSF67_21325 [Agrobacterium sp. CGMCC 11546]|nr:hypothetical protein GSF67_21325 [Agrobacterium sp. CGMCC 11546]